MIEHETSFRKILGVLRHPEMARWCEIAQRPGFTPPMNALYLKAGGGFVAYLIKGDTAEAHAFMLEHGRHTIAQVKEHFEYLFSLGIRRIEGAPSNPQAAAKAVRVGMQKTDRVSEAGLPIYEVTNG